MNRYLKLVHYEFARFRFIYFSLLVVTLISQFAGLYFFVQSTMKKVNDRMTLDSLSDAEYVLSHGLFGFADYTQRSLWFMAPIALCVAALLFYVFMIWYRDWLGKNMFIYRLMMLPTSRINIYLAKISVILLSVLGLVAFQLLVIPVQASMFNALVPSVFRNSVSIYDVISIHPILQILIPQTFIDFVLYYVAGVMGVIIVFTAILMERSYRWKGLIAGIVYAAVVCAVFLLPIIIVDTYEQYLYPIEIVIMASVVGILIACASLWLSFFLLKNKVSV